MGTTSRGGLTGRVLRVLRAGLLLGGVLACAASVYFARTSNQYYDQTNDLRLDPAGLSFYAAERSTPPPPGDRPVLLFFGDSRALMWTAPVDLPEWTILDRGIGQQTTAQILLRFDADVPSLHPAVVVLEAGVNDLKAITSFPARRGEIVSTCKDNLSRLVARCRALGATVLLTTVFSIGDVSLLRSPFWSDDVAAAVREVNEHLRGLAAPNVVVFDAAPILDDARGKVRPAYQHDFIHISPEGYAALNARLVPIVRSLPR
jgi:lysophospholipase L1-like esterase